MDDTTIHSLIRQDISAFDGFNCGKVVEVLKERIPTHWKRKSFEDFSYISVSVPKLTYLWVFLACGVVVVIVGFVSEAKGDEWFGQGVRYRFRNMSFRRRRWR